MEGEGEGDFQELEVGAEQLRWVPAAPQDSVGQATPPPPTLQEGREWEEQELKMQQGRKHEVAVYELLLAFCREKAKARSSPSECPHQQLEQHRPSPLASDKTSSPTGLLLLLL